MSAYIRVHCLGVTASVQPKEDNGILTLNHHTDEEHCVIQGSSCPEGLLQDGVASSSSSFTSLFFWGVTLQCCLASLARLLTLAVKVLLKCSSVFIKRGPMSQVFSDQLSIRVALKKIF